MVLKGEVLEREMSLKLHSKADALLVSSLVLRSRGLGQVDVVNLRGRVITVWEIKSSIRPGFKQIKRLRAAACFLSQIFSKSVRLVLKIKKEKVYFLNLDTFEGLG